MNDIICGTGRLQWGESSSAFRAVLSELLAESNYKYLFVVGSLLYGCWSYGWIMDLWMDNIHYLDVVSVLKLFQMPLQSVLCWWLILLSTVSTILFVPLVKWVTFYDIQDRYHMPATQRADSWVCYLLWVVHVVVNSLVQKRLWLKFR